MAEILEPWIHFIHVLSAIIWVGGGVMLSLIGARARKSEDARMMKESRRHYHISDCGSSRLLSWQYY